MSIEEFSLTDLVDPSALGRLAAQGITARVAQGYAYDKIKARWGALLTWGAEKKAPEVRHQLTSWRRFSEAWESGNRDRDGLRAQANDLQVAEGNAQLHGYSNPPDVPALSPAEMAARGRPMTPGPVSTPSRDELYPWAKAAEDVLPNVPTGDIKNKLPGGPNADPYLVPKAIGVGAIALGTVAAVASARSDLARAGIGVVGFAATGIAGWLAFAPSDKPKEKTP